MDTGRKLIYWVFKIQAIIIFLFYGINLLIPLALNPIISIVWIILGAGIWFIANGVRDDKRWAAIAAIFGTTLPYIILVMTMKYIQVNYIMIYEGSRTGSIFDIPLTIWFVFILNIVLSILLFLQKKSNYNI